MTTGDDEATVRLTELLAACADERTRTHWTAYLKGAASFRGVPMAGVRTALRTVVGEHDLLARGVDELVDLALHWTTRTYTEDKLAAVLLLAEHLAPRLRTDHGDDLARPFAAGALADWNVVDWYATKALHSYLTAGGAGPVDADRAAARGPVPPPVRAPAALARPVCQRRRQAGSLRVRRLRLAVIAWGDDRYAEGGRHDDGRARRR